MTLPRYGEYRDSGVRWLGDVPAHWDVVPLAHICDVLQTGPFGGQLSSDTYIDGGVPVINPSHIVESKLAPDPTCAVSEVDADRLSQHRLQAGDIVVGRRGEMGRCAVVPDAAAGWLCGTGCLKVRLKPVALASFVSEYLRTPYVRESLSLESVGSTMENLNAAILGRVRIPLPPRTVQQDIVAFLNHETAKIDALIAEQEKLIALLAEKRQATISHAVTRGLDPDAPMKDSGVAWLGKVPAHWDVRPLKYLVEMKSGGTPSKENRDFWDGDVPWASAKDLKVERLGGTGDQITQAAVACGAASLIPPGSVLVVVRGMILARVFPVVETLVPMAINQDLKALLPLGSMNASFLAWLLRGTAHESLQRLDEAGHGTKALRMEAWTSLRLPVPPLDEQSQIAAMLTNETAKLDALRSNAESAIGLLRERRSALIAAAVTGQIDVRNMPAPNDDE